MNFAAIAEQTNVIMRFIIFAVLRDFPYLSSLRLYALIA